jgi:hypothetical protein
VTAGPGSYDPESLQNKQESVPRIAETGPMTCFLAYATLLFTAPPPKGDHPMHHRLNRPEQLAASSSPSAPARANDARRTEPKPGAADHHGPTFTRRVTITLTARLVEDMPHHNHLQPHPHPSSFAPAPGGDAL